MNRIDTLLQDLIGFSGTELELRSDEAPVFKTAGGTRIGGRPTPHGRLLGIVDELATREAMAALMNNQVASFGYAADGRSYLIRVEPSPHTWTVLVRLTSGSDGSGAPTIRNARTIGGGRGPSIPPRPDVNARPQEAGWSNTVRARPSNVAPRPRSETPKKPEPAPPSLRETSSGLDPTGRLRRSSMTSVFETWLRRMQELDARDLFLRPGRPPEVRLREAFRPLDTNDGVLDADVLRSTLVALLPPQSRARLAQHEDVVVHLALTDAGLFRVQVAMDVEGPGCAVRSIPLETRKAVDLLVPNAARPFLTLPSGLIIVSGPDAQLAFAALVNETLAAKPLRVLTLEDPIVYRLRSVTAHVVQRTVPDHTPSLAAGLRSARYDAADVIAACGQVDSAALLAALELAESGRRVVLSAPGATIAAAIERWLAGTDGRAEARIRRALIGVFRGGLGAQSVHAADGREVLACEVLLPSPDVLGALRAGSTEALTQAQLAGRSRGMRTVEDGLASLVRRGVLPVETARARALDAERLEALLASGAETSGA